MGLGGLIRLYSERDRSRRKDLDRELSYARQRRPIMSIQPHFAFPDASHGHFVHLSHSLSTSSVEVECCLHGIMQHLHADIASCQALVTASGEELRGHDICQVLL